MVGIFSSLLWERSSSTRPLTLNVLGGIPVSQLVMGQPDNLQLGIRSEEVHRDACYVIKLQVELMQHLREVIWNLLQFVFPHIQ